MNGLELQDIPQNMTDEELDRAISSGALDPSMRPEYIKIRNSLNNPKAITDQAMPPQTSLIEDVISMSRAAPVEPKEIPIQQIKQPIPSQPPISPIDTQLDLQPPKQTSQEIEDLINRRNSQQLIDSMIKVGVAAGKGDPSSIKDNSGQLIDDYKLRQGAKSQEVLDDPNSNEMKMVREQLKGIYNIPENTTLRQLQNIGIDINTLLLQKEQNKIKREQIRSKGDSGDKKPSIGQSAIDRNFAKEYSKFVLEGGYADVQKGLNQLREVKTRLGKENLTGPIVGSLGALTPYLASNAQETKDMVEEIVQRNLRLVLGAQFTEKEGERLIARAYNPKLGEEENQKRLTNLIRQIEGAAESKLRASEYFERNGTLEGYEGTIVQNIDDVLKIKPKASVGDVVKVKGKRYKVAENGDDLIPLE